MPTSYTSLLGLALPVTGELSGTWGDTVNNYITSYVDASVAGAQTISGSQTAVTLSTTNGTSLSQAGSGATGSAQYQIINCTGNPGGLLTITAPAASKSYIVINGTSTNQSVKIVGAGPTTGVTLVAGEKAIVAWNGSDFVKAASTVITNLTGTLPVANGGTGLTSGTSGGVLAFTASGTLASSGVLAANSLVIGGGAGVAPSTTTTGTGVLTAVGNAVNTSGGLVTQSGTLTSSALLLGGGSGTAISSTTTGTGVVTALGVNVGSSGAFTTNNAANTFTALQTFSGSTSVLAAALTNAAEVATISATAATGTINYDVTTQSVLYYTSNASANWTVNFRASSGTSLNTAMSTGQSVTVAFLVTQGATAYYNNAVQIDGNAVTPKYQGGTAWTAGNASSIDAYTYTIVKTGSAAFTVFASQTQFK